MAHQSLYKAGSSTAGISRVSAADVLTCIKHDMAEFSGHFNPVTDFARHVQAYSGNMLELHFDRAAWFDYAFRSNVQFDKPLLQDAGSPADLPFIRQVHRLLLNESSTTFRYGIENICFEYDFPFKTDPSVFFDIHRTTGLSLEEKYEALKNTTRGFHYSLPDELLGFLMKLQRLRLDVVYFGCMLSRESKAVRLTIHGIDVEELPGTLERMGWCGDIDKVAALQHAYLHPGQQIVLGVDFRDRLQSRIGIEIFDEQPDLLTEKLYGNAVIGEEQYRFLQQWPGSTTPCPATAASLQSLHHRTADRIFRRINHFKFTVHNRCLSTKAYLYYCF